MHIDMSAADRGEGVGGGYFVIHILKAVNLIKHLVIYNMNGNCWGNCFSSFHKSKCSNFITRTPTHKGIFVLL